MLEGAGERRAVKRRWSRETKRRIVAESRMPDASVGEVAARHGISASLLSVWRGLIDLEPVTAAGVASFVPVRVVEAAAPVAARHDVAAADRAEPAWLRIALPDGTSVYISHAAHLPLLHGVLGVLRG